MSEIGDVLSFYLNYIDTSSPGFGLGSKRKSPLYFHVYLYIPPCKLRKTVTTFLFNTSACINRLSTERTLGNKKNSCVPQKPPYESLLPKSPRKEGSYKDNLLWYAACISGCTPKFYKCL